MAGGGLRAQERTILVVSPKTEKQVRPKQSTTERKASERMRLKTVSLGFLQNELKEENLSNLKSYTGMSASFGQTFLLNTTPSTLNYGFDVVYVGASYMNYKLRVHEAGATNTSQWHQAEVGIQAGMAVLLAPVNSFTIKAYARYAPTFSTIYADEKWHFAYGDYVVAGLSVFLGPVGIAGEMRYGTCKYKDFSHTGNFTNIGVCLSANIVF